jgi:cystathionine beta-synthase
VGVDPEGSILAQPESMNGDGPDGGQQIEGVGYDFIPRVLDRTVCDTWIKGPDKESFNMARRLLREEGMMCGGSSGQAMWAAVKHIKESGIGKGKTVVVLLPDNIRNYMTKHLNNDWMYERQYITE